MEHTETWWGHDESGSTRNLGEPQSLKLPPWLEDCALHADTGWGAFRAFSALTVSSQTCGQKRFSGSCLEAGQKEQTNREQGRQRKQLVRSLLPQVLVLALSLANADLSSDEPSCVLTTAVWEREGWARQKPDIFFNLRDGPHPVKLKPETITLIKHLCLA